MKATAYEITSYTSGETGYWEPCGAKTLTSAKRACTARFGSGYIDAELRVAIIHNDGQRQIVARKSNKRGAWRDEI